MRSPASDRTRSVRRACDSGKRWVAISYDPKVGSDQISMGLRRGGVEAAAVADAHVGTDQISTVGLRQKPKAREFNTTDPPHAKSVGTDQISTVGLRRYEHDQRAGRNVEPRSRN